VVFWNSAAPLRPGDTVPGRSAVMRLNALALVFLGVIVLGSAAAQPSDKVLRVGILMSEPSKPLDSMRDELQRLGYADGRNVRYHDRFARGVEQRYPALAAELAALPVDVIVTWGTPASLAAKAAAWASRSSWRRLATRWAPGSSRA
jgi:ABC-type uncharacterized transport system substrate-binding protein